MKQLLCIALLGAIFYSCGEEGIGFNAQKEVPLTISVEGTEIPVPIDGINPPVFSQSTTYELNAVEVFAENTLNLDEVVINEIQYEITDIEASQGEDIEVEEMTIQLLVNNQAIGTLDITNRLPDNHLMNLSKAPISSFNKSELAQVLKDGGEVEARVTFDFGELPPDNFDFNFVFYFDVTAKIRDL